MAAFSVRVLFTSVAVLLGTGILGLPLKLVECGYYPFLFVLTGVFIMQIAVVYTATDLLQLSKQRLEAEYGAAAGTTGSGGTAGVVVKPDLHSMGRLYLSLPLARTFDFAVSLTFISTLISYSLAGASAYANILTAPLTDVILAFVLSCTAAIVFAAPLIAPLVSVLTIAKVGVLVLIVALCGVVGARVGLKPHESWAEVASSFLVGTVAIGGIADLMPVMVGDLVHTAAGLARFRRSVIAGVGVCYLLNVLWAAFVLEIVPQTRADAAADGMTVSLEAAAASGEIATVPVRQIIDARYSTFSWIATMISVFITLSITVSFNAIGLGLKHVLDGMASTIVLQLGLTPVLREGEGEGQDKGDNGSSSDSSSGGQGLWAMLRAGAAEKAGEICHALSPSRFAADAAALFSNRSHTADTVARALLYAINFGIVLGVALADPSGFISVLETGTSMALNLAGGVFVARMAVAARASAVDPSAVLLPMSDTLARLCAALVYVTFTVAVLYDAQQALSKSLPTVTAGWLTGSAAVLLYSLLIRPAMPYLLTGKHAAVDAGSSGVSHSNGGSGGRMKESSERTPLTAVVPAPAPAPAAAAAVTVAVGGAGDSRSSAPAPAARTAWRDTFYLWFDVAWCGSVAWTHASVSDLQLSLTVLSALMVLCHQLLPISSHPEWLQPPGLLRSIQLAWVLLIEGIAPLVVSGLSFDLQQVGPGAVQLLLAAVSFFVAIAHLRRSSV